MEKKIRIGVIGICGFGRHHVRYTYENEKAELAYLCDIAEDDLEMYGKKYGVPTTTDYNVIVENPDIDAVIIALPDYLHAEVAIKAMRAGKHVLCEKPIALDLDQCKEMVRVADETGKYLMVGQVCRFTPAFVKAKELVDAGEIGELFFVEGEYAHDYAHMPTDCWRTRPDRHGMIGGGCHSVDLLRWIAGDPTEVFAYSNHKMLKDWPTDDCTISVLKFPNDVIGKVFCSTGCKRPYTMRTVIYGSKGTIIMDNKHDRINVTRVDVADGMEVLIPVELNDHAADLEIDKFCDCILTNTPPDINGREGTKTVSVCVAIVKSAAEHKYVEVDYNF